MSWSASAPSNIALIKYMGKRDPNVNVPGNSSISYTMEHFRSYVELRLTDGEDHWVAHADHPLVLADSGQKRFVRHLQNIKKLYGIEQNFEIRSYNDFPSDCGLASSASSFAALTKAADLAIEELKGTKRDVLELARLSRMGSGSSCRSFFSPWSIWQDEQAQEIELPYKSLLHCVAILDEEKKEVSSSKAHLQVTTSALFNGREQRANARLEQLISAMREENWRQSFEICWAETWDMHALFETSNPAFGYMTGSSVDLLMAVRKLWQSENDGPLVTMDAGPNVHLLFRPDQSEMMNQFLESSPYRFLREGRFE